MSESSSDHIRVIDVLLDGEVDGNRCAIRRCRVTVDFIFGNCYDQPTSPPPK